MIHSRRHAFLYPAAAVLTAATGLLFLVPCFKFGADQQGTAMGTSTQTTDFAECPANGARLPTVMVASAAEPVQEVSNYKSLKQKYRYVGPLGSAAIIETISSGRQKNYYRGTELEDSVTIAEIRARSVVLETPDGQIVLVSNLNGASLSSNATASQIDTSASATGITEFQKRIGWQRNNTNECSISQSKLLEYYTEVLSRKERIGAVFDTLEPLRNEMGKIEGYKVNIVGEKDFFEAVNFKQGDVVRSVNGIPMTNRRAAEKLVLRFATRDLDFVVIDMERDGAKIQQIYYIDP